NQVCGATRTQVPEGPNILISAGRYQDIDWSASSHRPAGIILLINTQYKNTKNKDTQYGMHSLKRGRARRAALGGAFSSDRVVGNPALCPAFRVRRGRGRENGFMTGRARRATRPTPE